MIQTLGADESVLCRHDPVYCCLKSCAFAATSGCDPLRPTIVAMGWGTSVTLWLPAVVLAVVHLCRMGVTRLFSQPTSAENTLQSERLALEKQKSKLSPVQDFVQVSKIGRRLVEIDKQLANSSARRDATMSRPLLSWGLKYSHMAVIALLSVVFWGTPLAHVPVGWFTPLGFLLCVSGGPAGHLGILPWCLLCSWVSQQAIFAAAHATGILRPAPQKSWMQSLLGGILR